jgi:D-hydroxyproline dehydrogenase subunit gamma
VNHEDHIEITIDGVVHRVPAGQTVAAAILNAGGWGVRRSVDGDVRGPVCGMGTCHECRVTIDGVGHRRACMVVCRAGMVVATDFMPELRAGFGEVKGEASA